MFMAAPNEIDVICYECNSILIGSLKNLPELAANVSSLNIIGLFYAVPLGKYIKIIYNVNAEGISLTHPIPKEIPQNSPENPPFTLCF